MYFSRNHKGLLALSAAVLLLPAASRAAIVGTLNIGGNATITAANNGTIHFEPNAGGTGTFNINSSSGTFTSFSGGTGTDKDINSVANPINTLINVPNFLSFNNGSNITFTLTQVVGGSYGAAGCAAVTPAAGQVCSPPGSPFNLTNTTSNTSSALLTVYGFFTNTVTGETNAATGLFTASYAGGSYQSILSTISGGNAVLVSYGAQFTSAPEPSTTVLTLFLGVGLVIAGTFYQKKLRNNE